MSYVYAGICDHTNVYIDRYVFNLLVIRALLISAEQSGWLGSARNVFRDDLRNIYVSETEGETNRVTGVGGVRWWLL